VSLSTCAWCNGHIPLGPEASNVCETCGRSVWSVPPTTNHAEAMLYARMHESDSNLARCYIALRQKLAESSHDV
jgi:hypothetical protein